MASRGQTFTSRNTLIHQVQEVVSQLDVESFAMSGRVRQYRGEPKVRIPERWKLGYPIATVSFTICDVDLGERNLLVSTKKPGAIVRIVRTRLQDRGIPIC